MKTLFVVIQGEMCGPLPHALLCEGLHTSVWEASAFRLFALSVLYHCEPGTVLYEVGLVGIGSALSS